MASNTGKGNGKGTDSVLRTVEELAELRNVGAATLAGVMALAGWADGKVVDEREFDQAVERFLNAPMGGGE